MPRLQHDLLDNPVARHEAIHLKRSHGKWFRRIAVLLTVFLMIAPVLWGGSIHFFQTLQNVVIALMAHNFAWNIHAVMKATAAAVDSIRREKQGKTWEVLTLTSVDVWRVVLGKWLGVMRYLLPDFALMWALKVALLLWSSAIISRSPYWQEIYLTRLWDIQIDLPLIFVGGALILVYTLLELLLSTALGLAVALFKWSERSATSVALSFRLVVSIGFAALIGWLSGIFTYPQPLSENGRIFVESMMPSLIDNGFIAAFRMLDPAFTNRVDASVFMLGLLPGIVVMLVLIGIAVRVAKFGAHWQGVDQPGVLQKTKAKHSLKLKNEEAEIDSSRLEVAEDAEMLLPSPRKLTDARG